MILNIHRRGRDRRRRRFPKGTPKNIIDKLQLIRMERSRTQPSRKAGGSSQKGGAFSRKIRKLCQI